MQSSKDSDNPTIRQLGGELLEEIDHLPEGKVDEQAKPLVIDIVMGVLARHAGKVIENDEVLPVKPLPRRKLDA